MLLVNNKYLNLKFSFLVSFSFIYCIFSVGIIPLFVDSLLSDVPTNVMLLVIWSELSDSGTKSEPLTAFIDNFLIDNSFCNLISFSMKRHISISSLPCTIDSSTSNFIVLSYSI